MDFKQEVADHQHDNRLIVSKGFQPREKFNSD